MSKYFQNTDTVELSETKKGGHSTRVILVNQNNWKSLYMQNAVSLGTVYHLFLYKTGSKSLIKVNIDNIQVCIEGSMIHLIFINAVVLN